MEPEVVATSPRRIKSPVPVCCGFDSVRMVLAAGVAPALATLLTSCLFCWTTRARKLETPADDAPAGLLYKSNPQAAAWRRKRNNVSRFTFMLINPAIMVLFDEIKTKWFTKVRYD